MDAQRLKGRTAVVTGAARGIGQAIAHRLTAEGAAVLVADIDEKLAYQTAAEMAREGRHAVGLRVDIADRYSVRGMLQVAQNRWGRIDILVNNAAIPDATKFDELSPERFHQVLEVNLAGALTCALAVVPVMARGGWGRIVNIASIMGLRGSRDSIPYSTAKGGLVNLTRCLACDLAGQGILVNAIAPGFIDTRMALLPDGTGHQHETEWFKEVYLKHGRIPLRRPGLPEEIAGVAYFLCSEDCRYMTGQVLSVDGGLSATF